MFLSSPVMGEKLGAPLIFYKPTTKLCKVQLKTWKTVSKIKKSSALVQTGRQKNEPKQVSSQKIRRGESTTKREPARLRENVAACVTVIFFPKTTGCRSWEIKLQRAPTPGTSIDKKRSALKRNLRITFT